MMEREFTQGLLDPKSCSIPTRLCHPFPIGALSQKAVPWAELHIVTSHGDPLLEASPRPGSALRPADKALNWAGKKVS